MKKKTEKKKPEEKRVAPKLSKKDLEKVTGAQRGGARQRDFCGYFHNDYSPCSDFHCDDRW